MTLSRVKVAVGVGMATLALSAGAAGTALADNPHAGNSGHFKGSANPCPQNEQQCPPQND